MNAGYNELKMRSYQIAFLTFWMALGLFAFESVSADCLTTPQLEKLFLPVYSEDEAQRLLKIWLPAATSPGSNIAPEKTAVTIAGSP